jgi:hypothetical protein
MGIRASMLVTNVRNLSAIYNRTLVQEAACGVYAASGWVSTPFEGRWRWQRRRVGCTSPPRRCSRRLRGGERAGGGMWGTRRLRVVLGVIREVGKVQEAMCEVHSASV